MWIGEWNVRSWVRSTDNGVVILIRPIMTKMQVDLKTVFKVSEYCGLSE
jgi:hypothetical protein